MPGIGDNILMFGIMLLVLIYLSTTLVFRLGIWGTGICQVLILLVPLVYAWYMKADFKKLFSLHIPKIRHILGGIFLWVGVFCLEQVVLVLLSDVFPSLTETSASLNASILDAGFLPALLVVGITPAIAEEFAFRGFLFGTIKEKNKIIENKEDKLKLNAYHSPSPMNELCDYICTWEKKNIMWDNNLNDLIDTRVLIVNNDLDLSDKKVSKIIRRYINDYAEEIRNHIKLYENNNDNQDYHFAMNEIVNKFKRDLSDELKLEEEIIANYVIKVSYNNFSISKSFAWAAYADYIIKNLKNNSNPRRNISIVEVPYKTNDSYEYLGKFYEFKAVNEHR